MKEKNRVQPDVKKLTSYSEVGKITLHWKIDRNFFNAIEVLAKFSGERFRKILTLPPKRRKVEILVEPLMEITFKVRLVYPDGKHSRGKYVATAARGKNIVLDRVLGRKLLIYLPDGYEESKKIYPVVYMHDGQNLFSEKLAFVEEWQLDTVLDWLISGEKIEKLIVVGIFNSKDRGYEYTPYVDEIEGGGGASNFSRFVVQKVIPYVERKYRVSRRREDRAIMGSSFGGLLSLWMAFNYPDLFSMVAALSPSLWFADAAILDDLRNFPGSDLKIWIDQGTDEWSDLPRQAVDILIDKGYVYGENLLYYEVKGADHNEDAWSRRVKYPFIFFKGREAEHLVDLNIDVEVVQDLDAFGPVRFIVNPVAELDNDLRFSLYNLADYAISGQGYAYIDDRGVFEFDDPEDLEIYVKFGNLIEKVSLEYADLARELEILKEKTEKAMEDENI